MARNKTPPADAEALPLVDGTSLSQEAGDPVPEQVLPVLSEQAPVVASVVGLAPVVKSTKFVVIQGASVMVGGSRTVMKVGKVVDDVQFDLDHLRAQGVRFQEVAEDAAT